MGIDFYKMRIASVADAAARVRRVFALSNVVSLALVISTWNAYFSWTRGFARSTDWTGANVTQALQQTLVKTWVDSTFVSIPALGVRLSADDIEMLGAVAVAIIGIWLLYSARRENHIISRDRLSNGLRDGIGGDSDRSVTMPARLGTA
jgi:hypothetical protein